jgi:hypothetical protein
MRTGAPESVHYPATDATRRSKTFRDAIVGIESSGGEGDPSPYAAIMISMNAGDAWGAATLATRFGAKIPKIRSRNAVYGYQGFATGPAMAAF